MPSLIQRDLRTLTQADRTALEAFEYGPTSDETSLQ